MNEALLLQVPLFATLPPDARCALTDTLVALTLPSDTILLREGEQGHRCYIVLDGQIEIVKALGTADERLIGVRGAGQLIGEMSLLEDGAPRTASARTRTPVRVLELKRRDFETLLRHHPTFASELVRSLSVRLREADNATICELREKNRQLTEAYESLRAAQTQLIEKEALERELQVARDIQEHMLPRALPAPPGFEVGARMVPARIVSGDFFDCIPLGPTTAGIVVGDVCGKGVPAALYMALTRSLLRAEVSRNVSARAALQRVNRLLCDLNDTGMFVTLLYGVLDGARGVVSYIRAGHLPPLVVDPHGALVAPPVSLGQPLGVLPDPQLDERTVALGAGSTLLLYSDGVTEAADLNDQLFGQARLEEAMRANRDLEAQRLCDRLVDALAAYRGDALQADDITLVAVRAQSADGPRF